MNQQIVSDKKSAKILGLLVQIEQVNAMIAMHRSYEGGGFMAEQYERHKLQFVSELKKLLSKYGLAVEVKRKAVRPSASPLPAERTTASAP